MTVDFAGNLMLIQNISDLDPILHFFRHIFLTRRTNHFDWYMRPALFASTRVFYSDSEVRLYFVVFGDRIRVHTCLGQRVQLLIRVHEAGVESESAN